MKHSTKIIKYIRDSRINGYQLVGVSSSQDYDFQTNLSYKNLVKVTFLDPSLVSLEISADVPEDSMNVFQGLADSMNILDIGLDGTDYKDESLAVQSCRLEILIDDDSPDWDIRKDNIYLNGSEYYRVNMTYHLPLVKMSDYKDSLPGDIVFNLLFLKTSSSLPSALTPFLNKKISPSVTAKIVSLLKYSSLTLLSCNLNIPSNNLQGFLFPVQSNFDLGYNREDRELVIGSLAGSFKIPENSIKSAYISYENGSYVMTIHLKYANIKLLISRS